MSNLIVEKRVTFWAYLKKKLGYKEVLVGRNYCLKDTSNPIWVVKVFRD
jgi:hypothetical protein